jgi:hypothetical protein
LHRSFKWPRIPVNYLYSIYRSIAQPVECRSPKPKVAGSIPAAPAIMDFVPRSGVLHDFEEVVIGLCSDSCGG